MNRLLLEVAVASLLALAIVILFNRWQAADARADQAEDNYEAEKANVKVVEKQVIVEVAAAAAVPVIRQRLERVCIIPPVADPAEPAPAADAEARALFLGAGPAEISACLSEGERLVAVAEAARNAGCAAP